MKINNFSEFNTHFQIFGSENSQDYDVIVFVKSIPNDVSLASSMCKEYDKKISEIINDKIINSNLGICRDGNIIDVFKGSPDEVNNALYYTYDLHNQIHPNIISSPVIRDVNHKIIRSTRGVLSFFSRTDMRSEIKTSLKGDINDRLKVLRKIDFEKMIDFPGKKEPKEDIYKIISFQYGQLFSLIDGFEKDSYTKNGIIRSYPKLSNLINRKDPSIEDLEYLNECNDRLIETIESRILEIGDIKEF